MIMKLYDWYQEMRSSFWFVPTAIVLGAVGLATVLIAVDATVEMQVVKRWPLLFGAGASGARGLLTAVASSMITVAGVVFSITIMVLALTSSQYTSRVLRNLMRDPVNQVVLGVFVGIFGYCLVVLRVIRGGDEEAFVPSLAVLGGLILAFVGIACLVFFIHYISMSIQASSIIYTAANEAIAAMERLFPEQLDEDADEDADKDFAMPLAEQHWSSAPAQKTGYVESIHVDSLLCWAQQHETVLRMERGIGEFVIEGTPLISVAGSNRVDDETIAAFNALYIIGRHRTVEQDASWGIQQIADVALKGLSPGINDATTAMMSVDYLGAILVRLASRQFPASHRLDQGELRVITRGPSFSSLLAEAFDQIRQNASGNVAVLTRLLQVLETVAGQTTNLRRRQAIWQQAELIAATAKRTVASPHDRGGIEAIMLRLSQALTTEGRTTR